MRKLLLSALGFVALSGVGEAGAADLPVKAAPLVPAAPVFSWSGLYFGASVGAQWFNSESSYVSGGTDGPSSGSATLNNTNAMIAFQFGRNWQAPGSPLVFGLEGDWTETNHDRSTTLFTYPNGNQFDAESQLGIQGSVRGRIGVAWDNWLLYATGGLALAQGEALSTFTSNGSGSAVSLADKTLTGWTVGGGVEWAFPQAPNVSLRAEYRYTDYGSIGIPTSADILGATTLVPYAAHTKVKPVGLRRPPSGSHLGNTPRT